MKVCCLYGFKITGANPDFYEEGTYKIELLEELKRKRLKQGRRPEKRMKNKWIQ